MDAIVSLISEKRLSIYTEFFNCRSHDEAIGLYIWNSKLSYEISCIINIIEVSLRNSIHTAHVNVHGSKSSWITDYFDIQSDNDEGKKKIDDVRRRLANKGNYSIDDIISRLPFGFWTSLCSSNHDQSNSDSLKLWPTLLDAVFTGRDGESQEEIFNLITKTNTIRNRISHHEVIWKSAEGVGNKSVFSKVFNSCNDILKLARIIGVSNIKLVKLMDSVRAIKELCSDTKINEYKMLFSSTNFSDIHRHFHLGSVDLNELGMVTKVDEGKGRIKIKATNILDRNGKRKEFLVDNSEVPSLIKQGITNKTIVRFIPKIVRRDNHPDLLFAQQVTPD